MPLSWCETVYLAHEVSLETVAARLADRIRIRGVVGPPLSPGDYPGEAVVEATSVCFSVPLWRAAQASAELSGSAKQITAHYSAPLPTGWTAGFVVLACAAAAWLAGGWFGEPFGGGLAFGLVWVLGGMYVLLRVSLQWRLLDLLKEATLPAPAPAV